MQTFVRNSKLLLKFFLSFSIENEKVVFFEHNFQDLYPLWGSKSKIDRNYFFRYITSFTSFTVRGTSGRAAVTKFGA
jgi:hypothetical protein